jgi:CelD/BcsL family acetyltransferase involved in cellulose biosynthesis
MAVAELIVDEAGAERIAAGWDALAVASAEPSSAPAWMLAWWRHVAPRGAELRVVAVRDGEQLIGLLPLYVDLGSRRAASRYRLLASEDDFSASVTPLAAPDRVWEVAEAAAELLAARGSRPDEIELAPLPSASPWTFVLRERWPGRIRPLAFRLAHQLSPIVSLHPGSYEAWLAARSYRFRKEARRYRRLFDDAGGSYRWTTVETLDSDVEVFSRLHAARWEGVGESRLVALGARLPAFLRELATGLLPQERFRMLMLELDGKPICADLWIAAGGDVTGVNTGWDERFKRFSPPRLATLHTIEDACARGERRIHLGFGRVDYKQAYANGADVVTWDVLLPPGATLPRALARTLPRAVDRRMRDTAKRVLPASGADRLRALRGRIRSRRA